MASKRSMLKKLANELKKVEIASNMARGRKNLYADMIIREEVYGEKLPKQVEKIDTCKQKFSELHQDFEEFEKTKEQICSLKSMIKRNDAGAENEYNEFMNAANQASRETSYEEIRPLAYETTINVYERLRKKTFMNTFIKDRLVEALEHRSEEIYNDVLDLAKDYKKIIAGEKKIAGKTDIGETIKNKLWDELVDKRGFSYEYFGNAIKAGLPINDDKINEYMGSQLTDLGLEKSYNKIVNDLKSLNGNKTILLNNNSLGEGTYSNNRLKEPIINTEKNSIKQVFKKCFKM
ncbi:MAG: hypothetical protein K5769_10860 [Pseudobutyrivibrio sp.]|nr:hypothetical protein [Pseudobutyrivibrio sp.]